MWVMDVAFVLAGPIRPHRSKHVNDKGRSGEAAQPPLALPPLLDFDAWK
jgi:hypothetical protein